jgi:hypothetical protein
MKNKFITELKYLFQKPYTKNKIIDVVSISILGAVWIYTLKK